MVTTSALLLAGAGVAALAGLPPAVAGAPATLVTLPGGGSAMLAALFHIDADARLLRVGLGGSVVTVIYQRTDLPDRLAAAAPVWMIGGGRVGCR